MKISQIYPLQLEIEFFDEESELMKRAENIIQKYLRLYDKAFRHAYIEIGRASCRERV